ncbi:EAL domain-containing protein [Candidatus Albibeggiatoa sp. nov. BB20]|uniref:EAL domain-containing protein n=1 Tax=Candidatus Albibeggiatoa sp. nov. BB20 TaxID=3162723 RepID=UPI0033658891
MLLSEKKQILTFITLSLCAVMGYYWRLPTFFESDFTFSSVAILVAFYLFNFAGGITIALLTGLLYLSDDPFYAFIIMLEALIIGLNWRRFAHNLLIIDTLFWIGIGLPILWLLHVQTQPNDMIHILPILFIRFLNGVNNAVIASLIITFIPFWHWFPKLETDYSSFRHTLFNLLILFALFPILIVLQIHNWGIQTFNWELQQLQSIYIIQLGVLSLIFILSLSFAAIATHKLANPLIRLSRFNIDLPDSLIQQASLPNSHLKEIHHISTHFLTLCRDMIQHRDSEKKLLHSQTMLKSILDNIPQYIFWKDTNGYYLGCNNNFAQLIGIKDINKIIGKNDEMLIAYNADANILKFLAKCSYTTCNPCYHCISLVEQDNQTLWFDSNTVPLRNAKDEYIGYLGTFEDITERKQTEEKLKQAAKVLENSAEAICITDEESRIIVVNRAFSQITGYDEGEILGKTTNILKSGKHDSTFYKNMWTLIQVTGRWEGEIWNRRKNGEVYPEWLNISVIRDEMTKEITNYLAIFSDITRTKQNEQRLAYLAHYDDLTGLPNRTLFYERVERALFLAKEHNYKIAVVFLDLDHFKYVNDTWGHAVGDLLLKDASKRIVQCVRKNDTVARLGGDEFTAVLDHIDNSETAATVGQRILDSLRPPFHLNGHETFISSSIGISIYPSDGKDVETLLKHADIAMYRAKDQGKDNYQFFTAQMNVEAQQRLLLETKLRHALERNELRLYYQPQVHLASGHIIGAEVLVRWQHPDMGLLSPQQFIPLAEETGLIVLIGEWVLHAACEQHKIWRDNGYPHLRLAVNLSSRQFRENNLAERIIQILEETEMDASLLELEITESVLMKDADKAVETLNILKKMGIQLAIDDFGTGYSSLNYLKRFPIDKLKIDKSFICDIPKSIDDMTITKAIVALARSLHLKVIAEGVETKAQLAFLKSLRCDEVQGYLISHPIPVNQFVELLDTQSMMQLKRA